MAFIKIGGLSFDSFEELFEYKRTHPEWDAGGNNIIDKVSPGETVTYNFGSVNGGSDKSSHSSHRTVHTTIHKWSYRHRQWQCGSNSERPETHDTR